MARARSKRPRSPRLVRVTRALKRASIVVFMVFLVYLGTVAYSFGNVAKDLHPTGSSGLTMGFGGNSTVTASQLLNVSNSGLYPLTFEAGVVVYTISGIVLGQGSGASTGIAPGNSGQLVLGADVSVAPGAPGQALLTNSETLEFGIWVNATIGLYLVVPVSLHVVQNRSWGAPFFNAAAGASVHAGEASVSFSFQNQASFSLIGVLEFQLLTPGGSSCGSGSYPLSTPAGQSFGQVTTLPTTCSSLVGDSFVSTLSGGAGSPYRVELPPIPIGAGP